MVQRSQDWEWSNLKPTARSGPDGLLWDGPNLKPAQWTRHPLGLEPATCGNRESNFRCSGGRLLMQPGELTTEKGTGVNSGLVPEYTIQERPRQMAFFVRYCLIVASITTLHATTCILVHTCTAFDERIKENLRCGDVPNLRRAAASCQSPHFFRKG